MKNLAKKIVALASVAVLTLAMGLTAFAAPSPVAGVTAVTAGITVAPLASTAEAPSLTDTKVEQVITAAGISMENAQVLASFEITGTLPADGTVVLNYAGITPSTKLAVLHKPESTGEWQKEEAVAGNGTITIKGLKELSPFAIVVDKTTISASSPKTGEVSTVAVVSLVALLACGVAVAASKKRA
ncbi:MAG: hypothetical protein PHQ72_13985 [Hespellia sp.]|nr:hypothetical protein [Hespellia sp.]